MNFLLIQRLQNGSYIEIQWPSCPEGCSPLTQVIWVLSSLFLDEWFAFCWSYPLHFYYHNYICCWVKTVKLLIMHFLQYLIYSSLSPNIIFQSMFSKILILFPYFNLGAELSHWFKNQVNLCFCLFLIFRFWIAHGKTVDSEPVYSWNCRN